MIGWKFNEKCPWHRWFAWHPVDTNDEGWKWLRRVNRRRYYFYSAGICEKREWTYRMNVE